MALPVTIPNEFANATASIPLSQLDTNFNTLANAVNGISDGSESLANVSVTGGTISNVAVSATTLNTSGAVVFNDAGADVDFRVEGDTNANLLFVDASADAIGIGTSTTTDAGVTITRDVTRDGGFQAKLALQSTGASNFPALLFSGCSATNRYGGIVQTASTSGNTGSQATASIEFPNTSATAGNIAFYTNGNVGTTNLAERMRLTSDGYLRMASGSGGIQFGGDTAAANALDDYEEGTFTPTLTPATSGSITLSGSFNTMTYTKIGRVVSIAGFISVSSVSSPTGLLRLTGLPFTAGNAATFQTAGSVIGDGFNALTYQAMVGWVDTNSTLIKIGALNNGAINENISSNVQANTSFRISVTYFTA